MNILVSSPMRVGSTWVHELLAMLLGATRKDFVRKPEEAVDIVASGQLCVLKSHKILDMDLPRLQGKLHAIRVLRNFKDSLISRALYCRNVRLREGLKNEPNEEEIISQCTDMDDRAYVNVFLSSCRDLPRWMEELVVFERGEFDHTFYYEMLLHNAHDQFSGWLVKAGLEAAVSPGQLEEALYQCSFQRMKSSKTKGFVGSTGVGLWMEWLDEDLARRLDSLYFEQRRLARENPASRKPVTEKPVAETTPPEAVSDPS